MRNDKDYLCFCCRMLCDDGTPCSYYVKIKLDKERGLRVVLEISPHNCKTCDTEEELEKELDVVAGRGQSKSNYTAQHLFPIAKDLIVAAMSSKAGNTSNKRKLTDLPGSLLGGALRSIMMVAPDPMAVHHTKQKAIDRLLQPEAEAVKLLPALVKALRRKGCTVELKTTTQKAQEAIYLKRAEIEWD
mmetsp:Transcript_11175/g.33509  ORF Transcript_11175/g.33509 Transcript_11175/m.33509 type:complete len:188 (-) Transcript_11175:136-699(-)